MKLNRRRFLEALSATPLLAMLPRFASPSLPPMPAVAALDPVCSLDDSASISLSRSPEQEEDTA
jgi:hypothetical protein